MQRDRAVTGLGEAGTGINEGNPVCSCNGCNDRNGLPPHTAHNIRRGSEREILYPGRVVGGYKRITRYSQGCFRWQNWRYWRYCGCVFSAITFDSYAWSGRETWRDLP